MLTDGMENARGIDWICVLSHFDIDTGNTLNGICYVRLKGTLQNGVYLVMENCSAHSTTSFLEKVLNRNLIEHLKSY